jgi:hypothetical protein
MHLNRSTFRDAAAAILVVLALALPVARILADGAAQMKVHFRTSEMERPSHFTADTSQSVCAVMAVALTYENRDTGEYTHVACSDAAEGDRP